MATDFSPDLSRSASGQSIGDAELRRLLHLLKRCFQRVVVAHPSGHVIWLSHSTRHGESLNCPMVLKPVEAMANRADPSSFAELIADGVQPSGSGVEQEAGPTPIRFKIFTVGRPSGTPLVLGVDSPRIGPGGGAKGRHLRQSKRPNIERQIDTAAAEARRKGGPRRPAQCMHYFPMFAHSFH